VSSSDAEKAPETRPQETPHHPEPLTRCTRNEGPFVVIGRIAIK
jgi:hypothetical protein